MFSTPNIRRGHRVGTDRSASDCNTRCRHHWVVCRSRLFQLKSLSEFCPAPGHAVFYKPLSCRNWRASSLINLQLASCGAGWIAVRGRSLDVRRCRATSSSIHEWSGHEATLLDSVYEAEHGGNRNDVKGSQIRKTMSEPASLIVPSNDLSVMSIDS